MRERRSLFRYFLNGEITIPWRRTDDPFKILVCELLLRKTNRRQVRALYRNFFSRFPDFRSIHQTPVELIEKEIAPLGMGHVRAIALKQISVTILKEYSGIIPKNRSILVKLPHIGPYTANAVLCFAFGLSLSILDTNVIRIVSRVFSFESRKRARDDKKMWKFVDSLMPSERARDFNQALLDFGGLVCQSRKPLCSDCPVQNICDSNLERQMRA